MRTRGARWIVTCLAWVAWLLGATAVAAAPAKIKDVRLWSGPEGTRLVIELSGPVEYDVFPLSGPDRIVVDLANTSLGAQSLPAGQGPVRQLRAGLQSGRNLRVVLDLDSPQPPRRWKVVFEKREYGLGNGE